MLMVIKKFPYMFVLMQKQYSKNVAFLNLGNSRDVKK